MTHRRPLPPRRRFAGAVAALLTGAAFATPGVAPLAAAPAAAAEAATQTVRPEVGKPLQAARQAAAKKRYKEALGQIEKAETVADRTGYEQHVIEEMKAFVYGGLNQPARAAAALEKTLEAGRLAKPERAKRLHTLANLHYQARNYGEAITYANRAVREGVPAGTVRQLLAQAQYMKGDYAAAAREFERLVQAEEQAGRVPDEELLQRLVSVAYKQGDQAAYAAALQRMVTHHPTPQTWRDLIGLIERRPDFSAELALDADRLRLAVGALEKPQDYMEMAQLLLLAKLPGEAEAALRRGFDAKMLGAGGDAARQQRLLEMAAGQAAEQRAALDQLVAEATSAPALVDAGLACASFGQHDRAAGLLGQALRLGGLKNPAHVALRLGVVQLAAGRADQAEATLRAVKGADGSAALAKLWLIHGAPQA